MLPDVVPTLARIILKAFIEGVIHTIAIDIISFLKYACLRCWRTVVKDRVAFYEHLQELDED
jgi:hypothetical protein